MMKKPEIIAFYLPQYYPVEENNKWFGEGFTEWTNVGKAKPLFKGHYQPIVPADLGYYDLRLSEVRAKQAELAKEAGISAFCYYHYWFGNGKQLLERPLQEVVRSGEPDFPFCICWANHTWYKKMWNSTTNVLDKTPIMLQEYPGLKDWDEHFYALLDTFKDKRYYQQDGKLVFVLYHTAEIPNADQFIARWQDLAQKEGLKGFKFMSYVDDIADINNPAHQLCEETIVSCKSNIDAIGRNVLARKLQRFVKTSIAQILRLPLGVHNYHNVRVKLLDKRFSEERIIPVIFPNWDNTARRGAGALVLHNATPDEFYGHCKDVFAFLKNKNNKTVFLKSWNEWGEGNYMEPCLKYRHGYIDSLKNALKEF